jgi:hypothetical protein
MKTKNILIGAGVVIVSYLLWRKNQNKVNTKKCLKWSQPNCIKAPCPAQCEQYEK